MEVGAQLLIFLTDLGELGRVTVSNGVVMATMPETVALRMDRMEPSPAVMDWRA